ncbi:hypothetical protein [Botrimarina sp.]|uniref:porin n=1 Tax=Botrimarina sp. TaxID=2795802 RepID=UPI0032EC6645
MNALRWPLIVLIASLAVAAPAQQATTAPGPQPAEAAPPTLAPVLLPPVPQSEPTGAYRPLIGVASTDADGAQGPQYEVGAVFDKGIFIRGVDSDRDPYSLYIGARLQLRYTGFARDEETWTDAAGVSRPVRNRNNFDSERLRLNLQGTAIDKDLSYYLIFDGDSDGGSNVDQLAYIVTYRFDDALQVRLGRWKVASDREWLLSSRFLSLVDRSMATEFFRVGFSDGVWLLGELEGGWFYETSLTNGLRTSTRQPFNLDNNLGWAATVYADPLGPYGAGLGDYEWHESPVVRYGASLAYDRSTDREDAGFPLGDNNFLRLSDGTRLADVGALGPGSRVLSDSVLEAAADFAVKWCSWGVSTEVFLRSIHDIRADGPIDRDQVTDYGYRLDVGKFFVPKRLDGWARHSHVAGPLGNANEFALGFNYYFGDIGSGDNDLSDLVNKFSMDVTLVDGSPVTTTTADLIAGDDGLLLRTQVQIGF